jgi:hypothetical protein
VHLELLASFINVGRYMPFRGYLVPSLLNLAVFLLGMFLLTVPCFSVYTIFDALWFRFLDSEVLSRCFIVGLISLILGIRIVSVPKQPE